MESDGEIEENSQVEPATTEDVVSGEFEVNSKGQLVKKKQSHPKYTEAEMVIVWHWFENRYVNLYGTGKGSNIAFKQSEVWKEFAHQVNEVEQGRLERRVKRVWKHLDNMKYKGMLPDLRECNCKLQYKVQGM